MILGLARMCFSGNHTPFSVHTMPRNVRYAYIFQLWDLVNERLELEGECSG